MRLALALDFLRVNKNIRPAKSATAKKCQGLIKGSAITPWVGGRSLAGFTGKSTGWTGVVEAGVLLSFDTEASLGDCFGRLAIGAAGAALGVTTGPGAALGSEVMGAADGMTAGSFAAFSSGALGDSATTTGEARVWIGAFTG